MNVSSILPRDSVVGWGTVLQAGRSPVLVPGEVNFFNLSSTSSRTMALGSTQRLTKMSTRNLYGGKSGRRVGLTTLPPSMSSSLTDSINNQLLHFAQPSLTVLLITSRHGPHRKHRYPVAVYRLLHSNWSTCYNIIKKSILNGARNKEIRCSL
jgi:hypothetical protein